MKMPLHEGARIRRLWPSGVVAYREHLLRLDDDDARCSRFGTVMLDEVLEPIHVIGIGSSSNN